MTKHRKSMIGRALVGAAMMAALMGSVHNGYAEEGGMIPYLAGVTDGIPTAAAPPPGLYGSDTGYFKPQTVYNGSGKPVPIHVSLYDQSLGLFWVPGNHILGASYVADIVQPITYDSVTAFGTTHRQFGLFNTIVSPINLSWMITHHLFVAAGFNIYLKDGTYARNAPVNSGFNYWTFEPTAAVSYLTRSGLDLTVHAAYDINTTNHSSASSPNGVYHSGQVLSVDLTGTQQFGKFTVGAVGYIVDQTTNDIVAGAVAPASPFNSRGNRTEQIAFGPLIGYNLGGPSVTFYMTHDFRHINNIGGNTFWLRLQTRF